MPGDHGDRRHKDINTPLKNILLAVSLPFTLIASLTRWGLSEYDTAPVRATPATVVAVQPKRVLSKVDAEFLTLMSLPEAPPMEYWDRLAQCETGQNWKDGGTHGGGVGFYTTGHFPDRNMGGWERMGGEQFADHPKDATKKEQVLVAMRTAMVGWGPIKIERDPADAQRRGIPAVYYWKAKQFGYWTWGCAKWQVGDPCGYLFNGASVGPLPHRKPAYCKYLKPIDYTKVKGSARALHNAKIQEAAKRARADGAKSVALPSAKAFLFPKHVPTTPPPATAKCPQWWQAIREAGFAEKDLIIVDHLIWKKSKCDPSLKVDKGDNTYRGLLQIESHWFSFLRRATVIQSDQHLFDGTTNIKAAYQIYALGVREHGWGWSEWGLKTQNDLNSLAP